MYHTFYTSAEKSFNHRAELFVAWDMSAYTRHILFVEKCVFRRRRNLHLSLIHIYLTKRHNPSIMMDEVMEKIRTFTRKYTIGRTNGRELSVDLGEICHYMTDFFTYPHNDDIYEHNLLAHYV